jgi:hypothetical protein
MYIDDHVMTSKLVGGMVEQGLPHTFLAFPRFLKDPQYAYTRLKWLMDQYQISFEQYHTAWKARYHPKWIHHSKGHKDSLKSPALVSPLPDEVPGKDVTIVTGTEPAASFLMAVFTHLGMPTGYTNEDTGEAVLSGRDALSGNSACWFSATSCEANVRIYKHANFLTRLSTLRDTHIGNIIVPTESLDASGQDTQFAFANFVVDTVEHDEPVSYIAYPRMIDDPEYSYNTLQFLMQKYGVTRTAYKAAHRLLTDLMELRAGSGE